MNNWIKKSSQTWKLLAALFMCLVSLILFAVFIVLKPNNDTVYLYLLFSAISSAFGMLAFFMLIKCPHCRRSVAFYLIKHSSVQDWLIDFINIGSCPICNSKF